MVMMVEEAATRLGVTSRDIRTMITEGLIQARRSAGTWVIEAHHLPPARRVAKPMSPRIMWATILGPEEAHWLDTGEKCRLVRRLRRAIDDADAVRVASWLAERGPVQRYQAGGVAALHDDARLVASGAGDQRAVLAVSKVRDFYVQPGHLPQVVADHQLRPSDHGNVWLRQAEWQLPRPVPLMLLVADLVDHGQEAEAQRLLRSRLAATAAGLNGLLGCC